MIEQEELRDWLNQGGSFSESVTLQDVGKSATINDLRFLDTKYGKRLAVILKFEDGSEKTAFLSKSKVKQLLAQFISKDQNFSDITKWIGQRVKIEKVNMMVRGEIRETVILLPV